MNMRRFLLPFLFSVILILTLLLSSRMIFAGDFYYLADQARDMLLTQDIVDNRNLTLIGTHSGLGGFFHGPLWLYLLIPFYILGGGDPFTFAYAYILIALITVTVGYFVGASLYGKKAGLFFAFLLAVSPSVWEYVPNTIGVNMVPLVFLLMFYFLVKYIRGDQWSYIFAIFFAGLSLQFETALPLILLPVVIGSYLLNKKALKNLKLMLFSFLSLCVSLSTFILFDLKHNFLMTKSLLSLFSSGKREQGYLEFNDRIVSHGKSLQGVYESVLIDKTLLLEGLLILIIVSFVYFLFKRKITLKKDAKELAYLATFPFSIFIFYLFYAYPVFPEYLLGLTIPVALALTVIGKHLWSTVSGKMLIAFFVSITVIVAGQQIMKEYVTPYHDNQTSGSYKNQKAVAEWIMQDSNGKAFGYFVYSPSTFTYGMDYLLWWETKSKGLPKPESKKLPTTYLILYPPLANDHGAHAFWKKTKIRTNARVLAKKTFKGEIIVEKLAIGANEPEADPTYNQNLIFR